MFNALFSQILGGLGGALSGGGAGAGAATGGMANPFSGALGSLTNLIGGPGSQQGTLFSLPGELATGVVDLGTSKNIIGDTLGLTDPILNLGSEALGGAGGGILSALNPFGVGPDSSPLEAALRALMPVGAIAGLSALAAKHNRDQYGENALP